MGSSGCRYTVLFTAADKGYPWAAIGTLAVLAGVGAVQLFWSKGAASKRSETVRAFAFIFMGTGLVGLVAVSTIFAVAQHHAVQVLHSADVRSVEGPITHFVERPDDRYNEESFDVNGVHFAYGSSQLSVGFTHTQASGGPLRAGMDVRIAYDGPTGQTRILELEQRSCRG